MLIAADGYESVFLARNLLKEDWEGRGGGEDLPSNGLEGCAARWNRIFTTGHIMALYFRSNTFFRILGLEKSGQLGFKINKIRG